MLVEAIGPLPLEVCEVSPALVRDQAGLMRFHSTSSAVISESDREHKWHYSDGYF